MGDRISVSFTNGYEDSPVLFNHWGGMSFVKKAREFIKNRKSERDDPKEILVEFIQTLEKNHSLYLGKDLDDGDNGNHGHHTINVKTGLTVKYHKEVNIHE
ncbi:MAG TPA: hypothetical protein ENH95_02780 [Nitrosopumilus sp.]|nr:hypothetical protein [Nitrosopumilus sp.]